MSFDLSPRGRTNGRHGLFIGRYFNIEFYLDASWFIVAGGVIYTLYHDVFPRSVDHLSNGVYLTMAIVGGLLFFLSILLHELGHSLVSQRCGIPVPRITLMLIGGVAEISREPDDAKSELKIALGGPLVSVAIAVVSLLAGWLFSLGHLEPAWGVCSWLATTNLFLVAFNMIPGYPLDGGRVLRALLWAKSGKLQRATFITSRIGIGFAWLLGVLGLVLLFEGAWSGFVFMLIALFLRSAAEAGYQHALQKEVLAGVTVRDFMTTQPICIPADLPLNLAVDDYFLHHHHVAFPVIGSEGEFRGILRLDFFKEVPKEKWPYQSAGDLAAERETGSLSIDAAATATRAMRSLLAAETGRLAVVDQGRVIGVVTRHDILQFIKIHTELEG